MEVDQTGNLHVTHGRDDPLIESDPATKTLRMRFELQAFRPLAVYKAFVKMAYGVMPAVEAADLDACRQWLDSDGVTACLPDKAFFPYLFEIQTGFIAQHPSIAVFRRKRTAETSYATPSCAPAIAPIRCSCRRLFRTEKCSSPASHSFRFHPPFQLAGKRRQLDSTYTRSPSRTESEDRFESRHLITTQSKR